MAQNLNENRDQNRSNEGRSQNTNDLRNERPGTKGKSRDISGDNETPQNRNQTDVRGQSSENLNKQNRSLEDHEQDQRKV